MEHFIDELIESVESLYLIAMRWRNNEVCFYEVLEEKEKLKRLLDSGWNSDLENLTDYEKLIVMAANLLSIRGFFGGPIKSCIDELETPREKFLAKMLYAFCMLGC